MTAPESSRPTLSPFGAELRRRRRAAGYASISAAVAAMSEHPGITAISRRTWQVLETGLTAEGERYGYPVMDPIVAAAVTVGWDSGEALALAGLFPATPTIPHMSDSQMLAAIRSLPEDLRMTVQRVIEVCLAASRDPGDDES